jgi:micrococcal nuclease
METRRGFALLAVVLVLSAGCAGAPGDAGGDSTATLGGGDTSATTASDPASTPHPSTAPTTTVTVTEVIDGDTVEVRYDNGTVDTVRLLGVDTPETHGDNTPDEFEGVPETDAGRECLGRWGERASDHASEVLAGEEVRLGFDENEGRRGYYGRLLAYIYVDGAQFNYGLVRDGYARMYDSSFVDRQRYAAAEQRAQENRRGLWACRSPDAVGPGAAMSGPLAVDVHADAAGNDNENLNDEYVVLTNTNESTLDLSGWHVSDAAGHSYEFDDGTALEPNESLTLYTGSGTDTATERYWGESSAVWNNAGDTVTVRDTSGATIVEYSYG